MIRLIALFVAGLLLLGCQRSDDTEAAPAAPDTAEAETVVEGEEAIAETAAATEPEVPVGECGDQSAVPEEDRIANTPRWSTASELENFGFNVYRGESEDGPFERLTADPIPGAGTSDEPHRYSFRDDSIDPCVDYWYYVESISTSGATEKFTPTFRAPAKRRAAE